MRITESQLRRVIRNVLREQAPSPGELNQAVSTIKTSGPGDVGTHLDRAKRTLAAMFNRSRDPMRDIESYLENQGVDSDTASIVADEVATSYMGSGFHGNYRLGF